MDNFDLKKYLSNNLLLMEEKLSPQEQEIANDILSVTEGFNDIMDKIKSYVKKGVLTLAIISTVVSSLQAQGQTQMANQVEKAATELVVSDNIPSSRETIWQKKAVGMEIFYQDGNYIFATPRSNFHSSNIVNPNTGRNFSYRTTSSGGGIFSSKESIISAFEKGLELIDNPSSPSVKVEGNLVKKGRSGTFEIEGGVFNKRFANQVLKSLQSFNPS